jgi:lipopolysaccharide exporter
VIIKSELKSILSNLHWHQLVGNLRKSSFVKNVLVVMSGSAIAQVIGFTLTPIISRLFSPSDFGVFGSFNAVIGVIGAGITLDYTQAIMLPKKNEDAVNLFMLSSLSVVIITVCCLFAFLFVPSFFLSVIKAPNAWFLVLMVVAVFVTGLNSVLQSWCIRVKSFKHTSASQVIRSLSSNGTQIVLGFFHTGPISLIFGRILGDLLASLNLVRVQLRSLGTFRHNIKWDRMKKLAKEYRDFPMYSASENVINNLSSGLPVLILTHFYGIAVAGSYAFGVRLITVPMGVVLGSIRQVLFQKTCEKQNDGERLFPLYVKMTLGLFALAVIPSLILIIWSPQLFSFIFGSQWLTAGEFARSLVIWFLFVFCNVPAVQFARAIRIQRIVFLYNLVLLVVRTLTLVFGGLYMSALNTVMLFALVSMIMNIFLILMVGYGINKKESYVSVSHI